MTYDDVIMRGPGLTRRGFLALSAGAAATLALAGVAPREAEAYDAGTRTTTPQGGNTWYYYPSTYVTTMNYGSASDPLYCVNPDLPGPRNATTYAKQRITDYARSDASWNDWTESMYEMERSLVWYCWLAPGFEAKYFPSTNWDGRAMTASDWFVASHVLISDAITGDYSVSTNGAYGSFRTWIADNILSYGHGTKNPDSTEERIWWNPSGTLPSRDVFDIYLLNASHAGGVQTLLGWDYHPKGHANVRKSTRPTW